MLSKCRAVVFNGDGTYDITTFDKPSPPDGGAVLKVEAVGSNPTGVTGRKVMGQAVPSTCAS